MKRSTKEELALGRVLFPVVEVERPRVRGDCVEQPRPCPFAACKYHLAIDVNARTGSVKLNFPDLEVWEMPETCALDVADRGGQTLEDLGELLNLTREMVRKIEEAALAKVRGEAEALRAAA